MHVEASYTHDSMALGFLHIKSVIVYDGALVRVTRSVVSFAGHLILQFLILLALSSRLQIS